MKKIEDAGEALAAVRRDGPSLGNVPEIRLRVPERFRPDALLKTTAKGDSNEA